MFPIFLCLPSWEVSWSLWGLVLLTWHVVYTKLKVCYLLYDRIQYKGTFQKRFSGFFFFKGGGYPPFPLRVFGQNDFPLRGGGTPQFR